MKKRVLSIQLVICLVLGMFSAISFAAEGDVEYRYYTESDLWENKVLALDEYHVVTATDTAWEETTKNGFM